MAFDCPAVMTHSFPIHYVRSRKQSQPARVTRLTGSDKADLAEGEEYEILNEAVWESNAL